MLGGKSLFFQKKCNPWGIIWQMTSPFANSAALLLVLSLWSGSEAAGKRQCRGREHVHIRHTFRNDSETMSGKKFKLGLIWLWIICHFEEEEEEPGTTRAQDGTTRAQDQRMTRVAQRDRSAESLAGHLH